jgi:tetratricopeptide (TPR) repeat protein
MASLRFAVTVDAGAGESRVFSSHRSRKGQVAAACAGVLGVVLAVAPNVATGGSLPAAVERFRFLAWPVVIVAGVAVAVLEVFRAGSVDPVPQVPPPRQLPPDIADFTGRKAELRTIVKAHRKRRRGMRRRHSGSVSLVYGPAGVGKSALVRRVGYALSPAFADGQLYVDLRGADPASARAEHVLANFLRALGVPDDEIRDGLPQLSASFRTLTRRLRLLVVLDNAADTAQVRPLLPAGNRCATLVTSRTFLALDGVPAMRLDVLPATDAALLYARASHAAPREAAESAVAEMLQLCGGLPLALRIAGARLRLRPDWSAADLAERMRDQRRRLDELQLGDLAVRASFQLTYQTLPPALAQAFRAVGRYGGTTIGVAAAARLIGADEPTARRCLDGLVEAMLLQPSTMQRYAAHDLLRLFAWEQAHRPEFQGERAAADRRLGAWYCQQAEYWFRRRTGAETPDRAGLEWFDQEWSGIVTAVEASFDAGAWTVVWRTVNALSDSFRYRSLWLPLLRLCELAVTAAAADARLDAQGMASRHLSQVLRHVGERSQVIDQLLKTVELFEAAQDPQEQAETLKNLGEMYRIVGEHQLAVAAYTRSIEIAVHNGAHVQVASAVVQLGAAYMERGDFTSALALYEAGETMFGHLGERPGLGWVQYYFGGAYCLLGRYEEAQQRLARGLASAVERDDLSGQAWFLRAIGRTAVLQRRWAAAQDAFRREVAICRMMKADPGGAQVELDAARKRRMVPRTEQPNGWI